MKDLTWALKWRLCSPGIIWWIEEKNFSLIVLGHSVIMGRGGLYIRLLFYHVPNLSFYLKKVESLL